MERLKEKKHQKQNRHDIRSKFGAHYFALPNRDFPELANFGGRIDRCARIFLTFSTSHCAD